MRPIVSSLEAEYRRYKLLGEAAIHPLRDLSDGDLARSVTIRQSALSVPEALHRSLAHIAYHVGQIVFIAKSLRGADWEYLSIPPGKSSEYNETPTVERAPKSPR
jgi:hypothetical protein